MDKRLLKRHKRQVSRAKAQAKLKLSEADLRTPEQVRAAREASRPMGGWRVGPYANHSLPANRNQARPAAGSSAKADA